MSTSFLITSCGVIFFLLFSIAHTSSSVVQKPGLVQSPLAKARQDEVKKAFSSAFADYMKFGFPYDEVRPVTKRGKNSRNGWSATLVDSLDTLFVMGLTDEFENGILKTLKVDFSKSQTNDNVSLFETTIRYLGGILSAYELSGSKNKALLEQAQKLGNKLLIAWPDRRQNLPFPVLDFRGNKPVFDEASTAEILLAEAGSLILEFERLSYHTQDPKYLRQAAKAMQAIMNSPSTFPGLPGFSLYVESQKMKRDLATWGGGADSYYEYLLKYGILSGNRDESYLNAWKLAVKTSKKHLIQVSPVHNLTYLASYSSEQGGIRYEFSHLGCFAGGNWLLGGRVLKDLSTFELGLRLVETCMQTYKSTATGLGPETFGFLGPHGETPARRPNSEELKFFKKNGFYIKENSYSLRPEVVESAFYAWRLTGDTRYQDFVWDAFKSLQKHCKAPASFSGIYDVNYLPAQLTDDSESFLYAELFKYIYLTFADPNLLSLDEYVFS
ncbi:hypothetical protein PCANC_04494 [Puccinia coronata f. sp. avenae]|uniref:alpha-1,2-Mannosidase n=1 Tax=Puccinia coronata f. sp. avenae TaxID=200324 RepID=A0A2N5UP33_9BASI|nr:hypothetical protein PCANC_08773 [Puccinia coronata f. sp. avenae]PLW39520.1 hypothetical protein PCASD_07696 [Puccinia coronata f. sp. avenae]PLW53748.1 hypothetical protein PCANC_04494 [Puccinia coronata f. sp. avenae]